MLKIEINFNNFFSSTSFQNSFFFCSHALAISSSIFLVQITIMFKILLLYNQLFREKIYIWMPWQYYSETNKYASSSYKIKHAAYFYRNLWTTTKSCFGPVGLCARLHNQHLRRFFFFFWCIPFSNLSCKFAGYYEKRCL